ncbi:MAG: PhoH family protein [Phycisphaerales bacterium]
MPKNTKAAQSATKPSHTHPRVMEGQGPAEPTARSGPDQRSANQNGHANGNGHGNGHGRPGAPANGHANGHAENAHTGNGYAFAHGTGPAPARLDKAIKHFVVDTNVLLHDPGALFVFQEHEVVIPFEVIEEIDKFKREPGDIGRSARECIRHIDRLRGMGRLSEGVPWAGAEPERPGRTNTGQRHRTGTVRIDTAEHIRPPMLAADKPDNKIIASAWTLHQLGLNAVFVSKDLNARIKADAIGLQTEDFENSKVDADKLYSGFLTVDVPGALIDDLYQNRMLPLAALAEYLTATDAAGDEFVRPLHAHQFVILRDSEDESHSGLARRLADTDHVIPVTGPRKPIFGILARNLQQTMALDLLMDDEIRMVTLLGSAGTGKTLLAVAAGMAKVFNEERYDKLLVARPIMPMGRDIGYLPGSKDDKLGAWMQPIFDNLAYLLSTRGASLASHGKDGGKDSGQHAESHSTEQRIRKLVDGGQLVLEPLTYIRGRSIPHQYMIVDEAQNLTPHEVKTIISRIGDGTKIILTGDIGQIDHPYLDSSSNGLAYAIEKMKGLRIVGHVTLGKSERSELASLAASLL